MVMACDYITPYRVKTCDKNMNQAYSITEVAIDLYSGK